MAHFEFCETDSSFRPFSSLFKLMKNNFEPYSPIHSQYPVLIHQPRPMSIQSIYSPYTGLPQIRLVPHLVDKPELSSLLPQYILKQDDNCKVIPSSSPNNNHFQTKSAYSILSLSLSPHLSLTPPTLPKLPTQELSSLETNTSATYSTPLTYLLGHLFNLSTTQALGLIRTHFELIETAINTSTDGLYIILDPYPLNQSDLENFQWGDEEVKALLYVMGFYQEVVKLCDMGLSSELIFNSMIKYPSSTLKEFVVDGLQSENDPKLSNITFDTLSSNVDFEILLQNISHNIIIIPPRTNYQIYIIPNIVNFALPYELIRETHHINEPNINLQLSQITQITHQMLDFPISRAICHILRTFKSLSPLGTQHGNINPLPINIITHSIDFPFSKNNININTMNPNNHPNNLSKWQLHYSTDPLLNILASLGLFEITTQITHFKQTILLIVDCMAIHNFIHNIVINNTPSLPPFYININPQLKQQCQLTPLNKTISITSYGTVCIGGTFDHLHIGHLALLTSAMLLGKDGLILGITSPEMLEKKTLAELIEPWDTRVQQVLSYCQIFKGSCGDNMNQNGCVSDQTKRYNSPNTPKNSNLTIHSLKPPLCLNETTNPHFEIAYKSTIVHSYNSNTNLQTQNNHVFRIIVEPLFDMYGPSTKYHEITCLILSKEVQKGGPMVNIERKRLDRPMCDLFIVPLVNLPLAETVLIEDLGIQSNHKSKHEQFNHYPNPPIEQINSFNTTPHCIKYIPTNNPQLKVSSTDFRMFYKTIQLESKQ